MQAVLGVVLVMFGLAIAVAGGILFGPSLTAVGLWLLWRCDRAV